MAEERRFVLEMRASASSENRRRNGLSADKPRAKSSKRMQPRLVVSSCFWLSWFQRGRVGRNRNHVVFGQLLHDLFHLRRRRALIRADLNVIELADYIDGVN